jgi:hypothetical protein
LPAATRSAHPEQARVLDRYRTIFVRAGAQLAPDAKKRLAEITERLASLGTQFSQNVLADEKAYTLVLDGEEDLAGSRTSCARRRPRPPKSADWRASTSSRSRARPSSPFLTFSKRRDLREQAFQAWAARGETGGATDNKAIIAEMVALRAERAKLLGYKTFAEFKLSDTMAKTPDAVVGLLEQVWEPARARAMEERDDLQAMAQGQGDNIGIEPWDWRFYAEQVRKARHDLDEAVIKPYFQLDRIIERRSRPRTGSSALVQRDQGCAALSPGRARLAGHGERRRTRRDLHRRLLRALIEAQRRLDEFVPRPGAAGGRYPPHHRQRHELLEGRALAAQLRRCAHALPRIRPRTPRPTVEVTYPFRRQRRLDGLWELPLAAST